MPDSASLSLICVWQLVFHSYNHSGLLWETQHTLLPYLRLGLSERPFLFPWQNLFWFNLFCSQSQAGDCVSPDSKQASEDPFITSCIPALDSTGSGWPLSYWFLSSACEIWWSQHKWHCLWGGIAFSLPSQPLLFLLPVICILPAPGELVSMPL